MKRLFTSISAVFITASIFAGGVVTNTNQSAAWVRLMMRAATTDIDAVYYNPAGIMKLENGLHFSVSNQTIFQNKEVENFYTGPDGLFGINESLYKGKVSAPVFPGVYAAYKTDRLAFSFGFNPIGGGGGAVYKKGLPSFEMTPSDLVPALASLGATAYRLDAKFEGTSIYFGIQGAVSYKVNDVISVAAGLRYVTAKNTYEGHLTDIEINMGTEASPDWQRADAIMTDISEQYTNGASLYTAGAAQATSVAVQTTALVDAGAGSLTLAQAEAATIIDAEQRLALEYALAAFGLETTGTISQADAGLKNTAVQYLDTAGDYTRSAAEYLLTASLLADQEADVVQTGHGFTPFFSINISPTDRLNIGIKYELATKMSLTNKTAKDFTTGFTQTGTPVTMFPDGEEIRNDMPAMLSVGVDFKATDELRLSAGTYYYFDRTANYGRKLNGVYVDNKDIIDKNYFEIGGGLEYKISDKLLVSGGYLYSKPGVNTDYQSDLAFELPSSTVGLGGAFMPTENIKINLGVGYSFYSTEEKTINHDFSPTSTTIPARETYYQDNILFAVGVDFSF